MIPKVPPNIGQRIGHTNSPIPSDSNMKYKKKKVPPITIAIPIPTLANI
jgi:hypothetical protein